MTLNTLWNVQFISSLLRILCVSEEISLRKCTRRFKLKCFVTCILPRVRWIRCKGLPHESGYSLKSFSSKSLWLVYNPESDGYNRYFHSEFKFILMN